MIDRLRALLNRPIGDAERPRLFALAAAVVVTGAVLLALTGGGSDRATGDGPAAPDLNASNGAAPPVPRPRDPAELPVPSEEGRRSKADQASPREIANAKAAAERFLAGYLPYTYGRGRAHNLPAATDELRRALAGARPRVPRSERGRPAEVVTLQIAGAGPSRMGMLALVDDGRRSYTVHMALARYGGDWKVTEVGG